MANTVWQVRNHHDEDLDMLAPEPWRQVDADSALLFT